MEGVFQHLHFGQGKGGNLIIKASESVEVLGTSTDSQFPSALFADVYDVR